MRVLQVGPFPPPHGGVSVHVYEARQKLQRAGVECRVLNVDPRAPKSTEYIAIGGGCDLFSTLASYAGRGWLLHVHTNGHNHKSWLVALTAGLAGQFGPGSILTLHSGLTPEYLATSSLLPRAACATYQQIIAVSPEIRGALLPLSGKTPIKVLPAFLKAAASSIDLPELKGRSPLLATTLFFRPEYGFEILVDAIDRLRVKYPQIACMVMGGEDSTEAAELLRRRDLTRNIILLGSLPHERCLAVMSQCDVVVRATLADGDANSVREGLAMGIPVVASDVGHRPAGTILFCTGDPVDLAEKIDAACTLPRHAVDAQPDHFRSLLDVYRSLAPSRAYGERQWEN